MPEAALTTLERTGKPLREIPVLAPQSGVVTALAIRQGSYVSPQAKLFEIANLQRVWVNVALYDYQLPWVRVGDAVRLRLQAYPGKTWTGRLSFLYPTVDPRTRTVTARLSFANTDGDLRPGMYADATVLGHALSTLAVPSSAVLRTQEGDYVMLALGQGHFLPVQVALGPQADGWTAIAKGLRAGDRVVESAQFLLYSESQFQSVKARMLGGNTSLDAVPPGGTAPGMPIPGGAQDRAVAPPVLAPPTAGSMAGMNMTATGDSHD
jgi:Cu(I)/Ag(I) efflux system membrane fusion protein